MIRKILVPTDGSDLSAKAIRGAVEVAKKLGAKIVGMTAIEPYSYSSMSEYRPETFEVFERRTESIAKERLKQIESIAKAAEVEYETSVSKSFSPYEAIIEAATENGCDAIFMASHGRRGLNAVLLGSETQKVLTHSKLPVMVYR
jgi:nucleotide-binding universal stress UspA family protein